jgi:hypothetical protein
MNSSNHSNWRVRAVHIIKYLNIRLSVCLYVYLSVCMSVRLFVCLFFSLSFRIIFVHLYVIFFCLSVHFMHICVYVHFCLYLESSSRDVTTASRDSLDVTVEISGHLERCYHPTMVADPDGVPMARVIITLRTNTPLTRSVCLHPLKYLSVKYI